MRVDFAAFKSSVGKRIFLLFVYCALVPIVAMGGISYYRVSQQLRSSSRAELDRAAKNYAMEIMARLNQAQTELELLSATDAPQRDFKRMERMRRHWSAVYRIRDGQVTPLWGEAVALPSLTAEQKEFLRGGTVLIETGSPANLVLLHSEGDQAEMWAGVLNRAYVFGQATLPENRLVMVTDASNHPLFRNPESASPAASGGGKEDLQPIAPAGDKYQTATHSLFLRAQFRAPSWTVLIGEQTAEALGPILRFRRTFPYIALLSFFVAILLSSVQIRRTLGPLEALRTAARQVEKQDFETSVAVTTDDEFGDLAKAFNAMTIQLGCQFRSLENMSWGTLKALARAIDAKSPWTAGHSERVTQVALRIAREMKLTARELVTIERGGLLHDIGKIATPPQILDKTGRLEDDELALMRAHVLAGVRILEPITEFYEAIPIVEQHHEWFNGEGYPHGLAAKHIHLYARIFAVADCYDALISDRPYRKGLPQAEVLAMINRGSGTQFDPEIVKIFTEMIQRESKEAEGEVAGSTAANKASTAAANS